MWSPSNGETYRKISNIRCTKSPNLNAPRLVLQLSLPIPMKPGVTVENEDVVGAAPTGDAPTTSEWSNILLPTKVRLILEIWRYLILMSHFIFRCYSNHSFQTLNPITLHVVVLPQPRWDSSVNILANLSSFSLGCSTNWWVSSSSIHNVCEYFQM